MKRASWTDYQKDIADDHYYYARSCIRQNFFPGSEKVFLNILGKDLGRDIFDDPLHTSCTGIGYHSDVVPLETIMAVVARQFALMSEAGYENFTSSCITSFGIYTELLATWEEFPETEERTRENLYKATGREFKKPNHTVAQILLTAYDVDHPDRFENFKNTMHRLLELKALPIINENDTVATEELGIGDNDTLGAIVAVSMEADLLILLSDIDGLYTADPHTHPEATLIAEIPEITREIWDLAGGAGSSLGTGGMATKLQAASICTKSGCDMVIANGAEPAILYDIAEGKPVGSRFRGKRG